MLATDGTGRCHAHKVQAWAKQAGAPKRMAGRRLQSEREQLFRREPMCRICASKGRVKLATERDHIRCLSQGGTDDDSNIQPLCVDCHAEKTKTEAAQGRGTAKV